MSLSLIVAMTPKRVIGRKETNKLPWRIKDDVDLFKEVTLENTVIMGRNTWDSIPERFRPLPNRSNLIVSSKLQLAPGAQVFPSYDEAVSYSEKLGKEAFIMGGARLYAEALQDPRLLHMYISHIKGDYSGDVIFPEFNKLDWNVSKEKEYLDFTFRKYQRRLG